MKIIAEYDPLSGFIEDSEGNKWYVGINTPFTVYEKENISVDNTKDIVLLVNSGITPQEMIKLRKAGLL